TVSSTPITAHQKPRSEASWLHPAAELRKAPAANTSQSAPITKPKIFFMGGFGSEDQPRTAPQCNREAPPGNPRPSLRRRNDGAPAPRRPRAPSRAAPAAATRAGSG